MKILASLFIVSLLSACGTKKHASEESGDTIPKMKMEVVTVKAKIKELGGKSDPFTITAVEVRGNLLLVDIEYSGGCEVHTFEVNGSPMIAKSLPPIRSIEILHEANLDSCRELKEVKLEIDVRDLAYKQEKGSEIYFTLEGYKDKILYVYE